MSLDEIDLVDGRNFVAGVPHHWFAELRREAPVYWHPEAVAPRGGFWAVTRYDDCVQVNRDWEHFSSARRGSLFHEMDEDQLAQQQLMMVNMDPTMHTRYRRLVNKGFTPKMVRDLEQQIVGYADGIIDAVCERGTADFVEEIAAELPLLVIAELLGVPQEDRRMVFDWSNKMIGAEDPEYQVVDADPGEAAMQVYSYAEELASQRRLAPRQDLVSVLIGAEVEGEKLNELELDLFFLLLIVAGNETTRNLMSGAMTAFFDHPEQWELLRKDRSLLPGAVEEMLRYVTPVMHFRRTATSDMEVRGPEDRGGRQDRLLAHLGQPRRGSVRQPEHLRHHPLAQQPHRVRRRWSPLLPRRQPRADGDHGDVRSRPRPPARYPARRRGAAAAVELHQRHQAHPGRLLHVRARRRHRAARPGSLRSSRMSERPVRFHQSVAFLPTSQVLPLARACDELGYGGINISDHLFNPRHLESRYTYSTREDGAPGWGTDTPWPDAIVSIAAMAAITENLLFTTAVYVAPARDLISVARSVGTAAVLSGNRIRLGIGVGWCKEEFDQTGQDFATRGKRLDEMIVALRALWQSGWVEHHGEYYDVPECQMEPAPTEPVPIIGGGHSPVALRRTAALCDGWIAAGAYSEDEAWIHLAELRAELDKAGRTDLGDFSIYLSLNERPDVDMYRRFADAGVTDFVCAPWMFVDVAPGTPDAEALSARLGAVRWFAEDIVHKV